MQAPKPSHQVIMLKKGIRCLYYKPLSVKCIITLRHCDGICMETRSATRVDNRAIATPKFSKTNLLLRYKLQSFCLPRKYPAGCDLPGDIALEGMCDQPLHAKTSY